MYNRCMRKFLVEPLKEGKDCEKLSKIVSAKFKALPYAIFCKALRNKDIRINDKKINKDVLVYEGDTITLYINDYILYGYDEKLNVVYEDENIIVAYKTKGIISNNETEKELDEPTFEDIVKTYNEKAKICHRLDRNTDGLVIFSKNKEVHNEMLLGFKNNCIIKKYMAMVNNSDFKKDSDVLEAYIFTDKKKGFSYISNEPKIGYEKIITEYKVLEKNKDYAVLNIILHTGKTHQIRAHLSYINHHIIGDSKYGLNEINKKFKKSRQCLTAVEYNFDFNENSMLNYLDDVKIKLDDLKL